MNEGSTPGAAVATLRALAVAAALACGAGAALASQSALTITSFSVSTAAYSGTYAYALDPYQSYHITALNAGGLFGQAADNYSAENWNLGLNRVAQTANAKGTGNLVQFTDASTALTTAGFSLAAQASSSSYPAPALPNSADASAVQSGSFMLFDELGNAASGMLTFDIYYDMSVAAPNGSASRHAQTAIDLLSSSDAGGTATFDDGLLSDSLAGGTGATSGHYSWSYTLAAGQMAYYTLSGSAVAFDTAAVAAVPEPETYALMVLGLLGLGGWKRRHGAARRMG